MKSRSMPAQDRLRSNDLAKVKQRLHEPGSVAFRRDLNRRSTMNLAL